MDINSDLGEGEPIARTRSLMRRITSANIACGGHAGTTATMRSCLQLCARYGVNAGAHPGFPDRENFGRIPLPITPKELGKLLDVQIGVLAEIARPLGVPLRHVKLHGALYHIVENSPTLTRAYVAFVKTARPRLTIIGPANGRIIRACRRGGVNAMGEIFAERGYLPDGTLIPRDKSGAILKDLSAIKRRARQISLTGQIPLPDGSLLSLPAQTICVHSDSPGAVLIASILAGIFRR